MRSPRAAIAACRASSERRSLDDVPAVWICSTSGSSSRSTWSLDDMRVTGVLGAVALVLVQHVMRRSKAPHPSLLEPRHLTAERPHLVEAVADEDHGSPLPVETSDLRDAAALELTVDDREHLV